MTLGIYTIILNLSIPLILQPQLLIIISLICYVQCLYYDQSEYFRGKKIKCIMLFIIVLLSSGIVQICLILGVKVSCLYFYFYYYYYFYFLNKPVIINIF